MNQIPKELCDLISDFAELTEKEWFVSRLRYILPYALNKSTQITIYKSDVEKWVLSSFPPMLHTTTDVLLVYEFENGQKRIEDSVFFTHFRKFGKRYWKCTFSYAHSLQNWDCFRIWHWTPGNFGIIFRRYFCWNSPTSFPNYLTISMLISSALYIATNALDSILTSTMCSPLN